ncbi:MAG: adenosylmethionine decarboxylase [Colwellia sp.]|nr:adenosylmethionine decarboxylase [Colwellia sp.]MCW8866265.1 adenosylmethionine decarboxylase [Colwellia sp.]MCW9082808.1 adenosylmethionine decarboxylase [Colwellia sp.]
MNKIALYGFNNLTKSLSFSLYKLHSLAGNNSAENYQAHIAKHFCANKLSRLLSDICHAIGGNILNVASQDYQPQGASVTLMISEEAAPEPLPNNSSRMSNDCLVAHLDKSHLCIHTYPEEAPQHGIAVFRADIELSTCGVISPLKVINYVIEAFNADVIDIDYRVRGMTRTTHGKMLFNDGKMANISEFISSNLSADFDIVESNLLAQNIFHAKLAKKRVLLTNYLFNDDESSLTTEQQVEITAQLHKTLQQLFSHKKSAGCHDNP